MDGALFSVIAGLQLASASLGTCELAPDQRPSALVDYHRLATNCLSLPPWPLDFDADLESAFVLRINEERRKAGLTELRVRTQLIGPARFHSLDQTWNDKLSHDGSGGRSAADRVGALDRKLVWDGLRENVGMVGSDNTAYGLVDRLHEAFMDSEYHRENILSASSTHVAIGVVVGFDDWYVTQLFASVVGDLPKAVPVRADRGWIAAQTPALSDWSIVGFNLREGAVSLPIEIAPPGEGALTLIGNRPFEDDEDYVYVIELNGPLVEVQ